MRRILTGLPLMILGHAAVAESAVQRSCGPANGERVENPYVMLHAPGYPAVAGTLDNLTAMDPFEAAVPLAAIGDFMQMGLLDLTLPGLELICSFDMYDANECKGFPFVPSPAIDVSLSGEILTYATEGDDRQVQVTIEGRAFDRASVVVTDDDGTTTSMWARAADGTETFQQDTSGGDEVSYIANPDCSGGGYVVRHNENGLLTTNRFSWSPADRADFTLTYKICRYQDPDPGCHEGSL